MIDDVFRVLHQVLNRTKAALAGGVGAILHKHTIDTAAEIRAAGQALSSLDHEVARPISAHMFDEAHSGERVFDNGTLSDGLSEGTDHPGDFFVTLQNGHRLQCRVEGPKDGAPIFQVHGSPGSRVDTAPAELLDQLNVRLITYDRPGYGGSDRQPGIDMTSGATHIKAIADQLGIERFAVVGRSGGSGYAAAAAAGLPDRVTRLALLVPNAPPALMKDRFGVGTTQQNIIGEPFEAVTARRRENLNSNPTDPMTVIGIPREDLSETDRQIVDKHAANLCHSYTEAFRHGTSGWNDDYNRTNGEWGFEFNEIQCPTIIWTAGGDGFTPPAYAQKIAEQFAPGQGLLYVASGGDVGHFGGMETKPGVYAWLSGQENLVRFPVDFPSSAAPGTAIPTTLDRWTSLTEPT